MSQVYVDDVYQFGGQAVSNLAAIENNFAALKSMFSGASAPADLVAGMHWFHTTKKALKLRNNANDAWLGILQADASHKLWVYRNTAPDGWAIDSAVVDCVLALKGGTNAYNANGGTQAGTWTQPDCTLTEANLPAHTHGEAAAHSHTTTFYGNAIEGSGTPGYTAIGYNNGTTWYVFNVVNPPTSSNGAHTHTSVGSGTAHNHGTTYRPAAAIGTLQYMDL
jgi:hypothetical protein